MPETLTGARSATVSVVEERGAVMAVTVLGEDRPGIVSEVTGALAALGGNLEDSTMTLLRGHFAMVVLVRVDVPAKQVRRALEPVSASGRLTVDVRKLAADTVPSRPGRAWTLRVHGADRPGIVAGVTRALAAHDANIVDLGTRLGTALYLLIAEVDLPAHCDKDALGADLRRAAADLGVDVQFEPVDDDVL